MQRCKGALVAVLLDNLGYLVTRSNPATLGILLHVYVDTKKGNLQH